jgi:hypothetical protein
MVIGNREESRRFFVQVWRKYQEGEALEPLERILLEVILEHPEYHAELDNEEHALGADYTPDAGVTNPFLHMGMHIAIREQIGSDRPAGISELYQRLLARYGDHHELEHAMMECLGEALWEAQRTNQVPDEAAYLECLKRL